VPFLVRRAKDMPSNALDYITVRGFKSITSVEALQLRPINVLIGSNGAGKSNFIGIFAFLHEVREGRLRDYVIKAGGAEKILHFGSKRTPKIEIRLSFQERVNQYELILSPTQDDGLYPFSETTFFWGDKRYPKTFRRTARATRAGT
jgi:predicted ATPase